MSQSAKDDRVSAKGLGFFDRIDSLVLVYVRVAAAIAIFCWADSFLREAAYRVLFLEPRFLFKYPGFEWVRLWPGEGIYWHFVVTKIASVSLAVGFLTRVSAAVLSGAIAYVLLVECQIYVNHYYLLACVAGMLVFLPAGRRFSVDSWLGIEKRDDQFWRWQFWLLRFQLGIPYVFGALAKLNGDWLRGQPAEIILRERTNIDGLGALSQLPYSVETMAYGGFLYDLLVVPMLLYRPTRTLAIVLSLLFHLANALIFEIGVFPWFMLATLVVFLPVDTLQERLRLFLGQQAREGQDASDFERQMVSGQDSVISITTKAGVVVAAVYVLIQLVLPFRPYMYAGDANWNEHGHRFAWRMMLRHKQGLTHFLLVDQNSPEYVVVPSTIILTLNQASEANHHPELVRQTAERLRELARVDLGVQDCRVHALALVTLNGRRPTPIVDPNVDLSRVDRDWRVEDWLIDDAGEFLDPPWTYPTSEWWKEIQLPERFRMLQGRTPEDLQAYLENLGAKIRAENASGVTNQ